MLNFAGKRWWYLGVGIAMLVAAIVILIIPPRLRPGIEFTSGSTFTLEFVAVPLTNADGTPQLNEDGSPKVHIPDVNTSGLDADLEALDHAEARIQTTGVANNFLIRTDELEGAPPLTGAAGPVQEGEIDVIERTLCEKYGVVLADGGCQGVLRKDFSTVSGTVSTEIARNATIAVVAASVMILIYITLAFRRLPKPWRYGTAAIVSLVHDAIIVLAVYSVLGKVRGTEVDTAFITAVLTVIGFSVHDTIVVFDRIREKLAHDPYIPFAEAVNASLTETLARSINTSLVIVFTLVAMLLIGGSTIQSFVLVLLVGVIAGTYSSIGIASQFLVAWEYNDLGRFWRRLRGAKPEPAPAPGEVVKV